MEERRRCELFVLSKCTDEFVSTEQSIRRRDLSALVSSTLISRSLAITTTTTTTTPPDSTIMMYQIVPALAALSALLVTSGAQTPPWFCQSYDCPAFTSRNEGGYEVRNYEETVWATTSLTTANQELSRNERSAMFRELFNYISGRNTNNQRIDMTVPVLTKIETLANGYRTTMMFYLSVANAPAPTSDNVVLVTRPAGPVFVKSFPGWLWPSSRTYTNKVAEMKREIGTTSLYDDNTYYKAGYNAPYDFFSRKQFEVWVDAL